jgi:hypothetical protein
MGNPVRIKVKVLDKDKGFDLITAKVIKRKIWMRLWQDKAHGKGVLIASGATYLEVTKRKCNLLPNKEKLWCESRSKVWKRIKRFPHKILKDGVVT